MLFILAANTSAADITFTHALSWKMPSEGTPRASTIEAIWDEKSLGTIAVSEKILANANITSQDVIRIDRPTFNYFPKLNEYFRREPPYMYSKYIFLWYDKGVHLYFYRERKQYTVHTISWLSYGHLTEPLHQLPTHLFFDGKDMGLMEQAIKQLDHFPWEKGSVLQYLTPNIISNEGRPAPDSFNYFLNRMRNSHGVEVEKLIGKM